MFILLSDVHKLLLGDIPLNVTDLVQNERRHAHAQNVMNMGVQ